MEKVKQIRFFNKEKLVFSMLPKPSIELAELFGILVGDGHLIISTGKRKIYRIEIDLNATEDILYIDYVKKLLQSLFNNINPIIKLRNDGRTTIVVNSKQIAYFVHKLGFPSGKKKGNIIIPKWIARKKMYIQAFLRGLVDTDGCLCFAKRGTYLTNKYPVIAIKLYDPFLLDQLEVLFEKIGLKPVRSKVDIQFNGKDKLNFWLKNIGFSNFNSYSRFLVWQKQGYCPKGTTLKMRQNLLNNTG